MKENNPVLLEYKRNKQICRQLITELGRVDELAVSLNDDDVCNLVKVMRRILDGYEEKES